MSSRWGVSVRKTWQIPVWTPADMRSVNGPTELTRVADPLDRPLHVGGRAARPRSVPVTGEQQQERVAAELEHVAAMALRDLDQLGEDARDRRDELLGSLSAASGELLRQRREACDVH